MRVLAVVSFEDSHQFESWQKRKFQTDDKCVEIYSISFEYVEYTPREKYFINVVYWKE